jgi:hypothetical protein
MRQRVGKCERLLASVEGLVRIAKAPEGPGEEREAVGPQVVSVDANEEPVLVRVVEGERLLEVGAGSDQGATIEQGHA